ncbi:MAG: DUF4234 domain-containing protein [Planctomycetota bacterium]|nr:DUF4234 domain-containing protein [Planctomycetota bacterium]
MVYCSGCGEQALKNATFCDYCGGDLPRGQPGLEESPGDAPARISARAEEKPSSRGPAFLVMFCALLGALLTGASLVYFVGDGGDPGEFLGLIIYGSLIGGFLSGFVAKAAVQAVRGSKPSPYSGERFSYSGSRSDRPGLSGDQPLPESAGRFKIWWGVLLSIVTFGLYLFFWKRHQMKVLNSWLGRQEHSFWKWLLLSLLSCGLYTLYHEYKTGRDINEIQRRMGWPEAHGLGILSLLATLFGAGLLSVVLQQEAINKFYTSPKIKELS